MAGKLKKDIKGLYIHTRTPFDSPIKKNTPFTGIVAGGQATQI